MDSFHTTPIWALSSNSDEESFWPSFADIMMVITMIFLLVSVIVILSNTRLTEELHSSLLAEASARKAAQKAEKEIEFQLQTKTSLEDQLAQARESYRALEIDLLSSRAKVEQVQQQTQVLQENLDQSQEQISAQKHALAVREQNMEMMQQQLIVAATEQQQVKTALQTAQEKVVLQEQKITVLKTRVDEGTKQLLSLQGDYTELDSKYQKLLRPARSSKGKQVVEVIYRKNAIQLRKPDEATRKSVTQKQLIETLDRLKHQLDNQLYVRIIIPKNSQLTYNEAWKFTQDILYKYDYYYTQNP